MKVCNKYYSVICLLLWLGNSSALTLPEVIKQVVTKDPKVLQQKYASLASEQLDHNSFLPHLQLRGDIDVADHASPLTRKLNAQHKALFGHRVTLELRQPLVDLQRWYMRDIYQQEANANKWLVQATVNQQILLVVESYIHVLLTKEKLWLVKQHMQQQQSLLQYIEQRTLAQANPDITKVKNNLLQLSMMLEEYRCDYDNATRMFTSITQLSAHNLSPLNFKLVTRLIPLSSWQRQAVTNNPMIKAANYQLRAMQARYQQAATTNYPTLEYTAGIQFGNNLNGLIGSARNYSTGLSLSWNLLDGGKDLCNKRSLAYRVQEYDAKYKLTAHDLQNNITKLWNYSNKQHKLWGHHLQLTKLANTAASEQLSDFKSGKASVATALVSMRKQLSMELELLTLKYARLWGHYQLLAGTGELGSSVNFMQAPEPQQFESMQPSATVSANLVNVVPVKQLVRKYNRYQETTTLVSNSTHQYTIQLLSTTNFVAMQNFMRRLSSVADLVVTSSKLSHNTKRYHLSCGSFPSLVAAKKALAQLPITARQYGPWIKKL